MKRILIATLALVPLLSGITQAQRATADERTDRDTQVERMRGLKEKRDALRRELGELRKRDTRRQADRRGGPQRGAERSHRGQSGQRSRGTQKGDQQRRRGLRDASRRSSRRPDAGERSRRRRGSDLERRSPEKRAQRAQRGRRAKKGKPHNANGRPERSRRR